MKHYFAKYHAPITPAHVVLKIPRATPHVQSHTVIVAAIAQFAQLLTCHSKAELPAEGPEVPKSNKRKIRVRNGMEEIKDRRRIVGERARRKGLFSRRCVVNVNVEDVVWIFRGKCTSRRAVRSESTNGTKEKSRSLKGELTSSTS